MEFQSWTHIRELAHWVIEGPRSLLYLGDESGIHNGWLLPSVSWKEIIVNELAQSWQLCRLAHKTNPSHLPDYLLRHAVWDSHADRAHFVNPSYISESQSSCIILGGVGHHGERRC